MASPTSRDGRVVRPAAPGGSLMAKSLAAIGSQESLTDRVRASIRDAIIDGELAPGTLHSVQSLAESLEVSRTPVREALIELANNGMVRFERNRGVRILQTSIHDLEEILTLRLLLEVPAVYRAISQISEQTIKELRKELAAMERAAKQDDEGTMMRHDRRFHGLLNKAAGNHRLAEFVDALRDQVLTRGVSTVGRSRSLDEIVDEHTKVLTAVENGDAVAAATAMREHLTNTALLLLRQEGGREDVELPWGEFVSRWLESETGGQSAG